MFKHILVATDFAPPSEHAVDLAMHLASTFGAKLTLVHAYEVPSIVYTGMSFTAGDLITPIREGAQAALDAAIARVRLKVPGATSLLRNGYPATELLSAIDEVHADLLVVGTHGRRGLPHVLLGSVAEKLVRLSPIPVLVARAAP